VTDVKREGRLKCTELRRKTGGGRDGREKSPQWELRLAIDEDQVGFRLWKGRGQPPQEERCHNIPGNGRQTSGKEGKKRMSSKGGEAVVKKGFAGRKRKKPTGGFKRVKRALRQPKKEVRVNPHY